MMLFDLTRLDIYCTLTYQRIQEFLQLEKKMLALLNLCISQTHLIIRPSNSHKG